MPTPPLAATVMERPSEDLGRLGEALKARTGDAELSLLAGPELIAERLLEALEEPFKLAGAETHLTVTASIGIAQRADWTPVR